MPYQKSRNAFARYAAWDHPKLPDQPEDFRNLSALQIRLGRWQNRNFDSVSLKDAALGMAEEVGEAALGLLGLTACMGKVTHAVLKNSQGIRGMEEEERFRAAVADGIADAMIYATQLCTMLRIDFGTLYTETAEQVMKREWKKEHRCVIEDMRPETYGEKQKCTCGKVWSVGESSIEGKYAWYCWNR